MPVPFGPIRSDTDGEAGGEWDPEAESKELSLIYLARLSLDFEASSSSSSVF